MLPASVVRPALLSVPCIVVALWTFGHLNQAIGPTINPVLDICGKATESIGNPVTKLFYYGNCFMVPFFAEVVATAEGKVIFGYLISLFAAFSGFQGVESSRLGARPPLFLTPIFALVFVFVAVSVGVPLLWLPTYFAVGMPSCFRGPLFLSISWPRVLAVSLMTIGYFVNGLACLLTWTQPHVLETLIKLQIWLPIFTPLLWILVPVSKPSYLTHLETGAVSTDPVSTLPVSKQPQSGKGHQAVMYMHCLNAGVGLTCHCALFLYLASQPRVTTRLVQLVSSHEGPNSYVYFLLIDLIVFWAALVYQVLAEDGPLVMLWVVAATPILGLASPLCFYYLYRESKIHRDDIYLRLILNDVSKILDESSSEKSIAGSSKKEA